MINPSFLAEQQIAEFPSSAGFSDLGSMTSKRHLRQLDDKSWLVFDSLHVAFNPDLEFWFPDAWQMRSGSSQKPGSISMTRIMQIVLANGLPTTRKKQESGILL
jgi:hypothetical protein